MTGIMMSSSQKKGMSSKMRKPKKTISEVAKTMTTEANDCKYELDPLVNKGYHV